MKKRVISAIVAALIVIPVCYFGGNYYRIGVGILAVLGFTEFLMAKDNIKEIPNMVKILSYLYLFMFIALQVLNKNNLGE